MHINYRRHSTIDNEHQNVTIVHHCVKKKDKKHLAMQIKGKIRCRMLITDPVPRHDSEHSASQSLPKQDILLKRPTYQLQPASQPAEQ